MVAQREQVWLDRSSYRRRAVAVVIDTAIGFVLLVAIAWVLETNGRPEPAGPWVTPTSVLAVVAIVGYLSVSTWYGATLGMRAVDLRVVDARDAGPVEFWRGLGRSVLLLATFLALYAIDSWLVPAYGLLMFQADTRQLPHDLLTKTRVVRRYRQGDRAAGDTGREEAPPDPVSSAAVAALDPDQARTLLDEMSGVKRRVRGDVRVSSVPVLILGMIAIGGALVALAEDDLFILSFGYWWLAAPAGLVLTQLWLRRVQRRAGIRPAHGWLVAVTAIAAVAPFVGGLFPYGSFTIGLAFLALAIHERSRLTAAAAVLCGVVVGLEQPWHFISVSVVANRFPGTSVATFMGGDHGTPVVYAAVGIVLLVAGASTRRSLGSTVRDDF